MRIHQQFLGMVTNSGTSRLDSTLRAIGEEQGSMTSSLEVNNDVWINPPGRSTIDITHGERNYSCCTNNLMIGTWNIQGMSPGKLNIVKREMVRNKLTCSASVKCTGKTADNLSQTTAWFIFPEMKV